MKLFHCKYPCLSYRKVKMARKYNAPVLILFMSTLFTILQIMAVQSEDIELINKCTYSANKRILNCVGLENMNKNVAMFITPATQMLFIRDSKNVIFPINHHTNPSYSRLVGYQILKSKYFLVNPGAFLGLSNVQYMEIHDNIWNTVEDETFIGLRNLSILNLANNGIKELGVGSFNHLNKLINLDLSQNLLEVIPAYVFEHLKELDAVYINNNLVKTIEQNAFSGLRQLSMIFLTNNSLEQIDTNEFNKLKNVGHLHLSFNKIGTINGQLILPKLKFLQLSNNQLSHLENNIFQHCTSLLSIDLSHNHLRSLIENPFLNLRQLKHLNLYRNYIDLSKFSILRVNTTIVHD